MTNKISIKISEDGKEFLKRFRANRIKADVDSEEKSYWELIEIIEKYFKLNNGSYLELLKITK